MKKKAKSKVKAPKRSAKSSSKKMAVEQPEMPDLVTVMMKIAERLESLEKKMDLVMSQSQAHRSEAKPVASPTTQRPQPFQPAPRHQHQPQPSLSHQAIRQPQVSSQQQQQQNQSGQGRRERMLYQAVCADCSQSCEIPFKPTGERPVYCKECFAKRKSANNFTKPAVEPQQRQLQVFKKREERDNEIVRGIRETKHPHEKQTPVGEDEREYMNEELQEQGYTEEGLITRNKDKEEKANPEAPRGRKVA